MAEYTKVDYPNVQNYIVKFSWSNKVHYLILAYDCNNEFRFVDLRTGQILNMRFESVEEAEKWLRTVAIIHEQNAICTTYVP